MGHGRSYVASRATFVGCFVVRDYGFACMANSLRSFFEGPAGKATGIGLAIIGIVAIAQSIRSNLGASDAARLSQSRHYVDAVTGKDFEAPVIPGTTDPVKAPSGGNTGYPAEECWWTRDGKIRSSPYYVLLKMYK